MFCDTQSQDIFFKINCSDWECVVKSSSPLEAAIKALKEKLILDIKTNVSFILSVTNLENKELEIYYVPELLQEIGLFKISKELDYLSNFLLDKAKNSH